MSRSEGNPLLAPKRLKARTVLGKTKDHEDEGHNVSELDSELDHADAGVARTKGNGLLDKSPAQADIETAVKRITDDDLLPHDAVFQFISTVTYTEPTVMLLGNHSSGKSTLINYLCGREIQNTGVAPTDDGFTVIKRCDFDENNDGPTIVSDPQYQFQDLQKFGFSFINHFRMKKRKMPTSSKISLDLTLIDTPGMIDTPVHVSDRSSVAGQLRGYDFLAVTRWFAQRSDVILLMFDPANPGTTGETLDVLTKSLNGLEHKFILVFNKVDVFEKGTDFARAYGALCWNLSKVINVKDIPRIYTSFTPVNNLDGSGSTADARSGVDVIPTEELNQQREEIVEEILSAPLRRLDNLLTELEEGSRRVLLAAQVCNAMKADYRTREVFVYSGFGTFCFLAPAFVFSLASISVTGTVVATAIFAACGFAGVPLMRSHLESYREQLFSTCDQYFERLHHGKSRTKSAELRWLTTVKPEIIRFSESFPKGDRNTIVGLPSTSSRACRRIAAVISDDLPALRLRVSTLKQEESRRRWGDRSLFQ